MFSKTLFPVFLCCWLVSPAFGQQLPSMAKDLLEKHHSPGKIVQLPVCSPDSVLSFVYATPSDSTLDQRTVYKKYGDETVASYVYQIDPPILMSYDSTIYDAMAREILNELWEYDESDEMLVFEHRTLYYPRGATALVDSVVEYRISFSSGEVEPYAKTVNVFGPGNQLQEVQEFYWDDEFLPDSKEVYYYGPEELVDHIEYFYWDGTEFVLEYNTVYSYDGNDSLVLMLETEVATGSPASKTEFIYNPAEYATRMEISLWDGDAEDWVLFYYLVTDNDEMSRPEALETGIIFFVVIGVRTEIEYIGDSPCPWYAKAYVSDDFQTWEFTNTQYFFPNYVSSIYEPLTYDWKIFPNPATGEVQISFPKGDEPFTRFSLINTLGQTSLQGECRYPFTGIDIATLNSGAYFLVLYGEKGVVAKKLWVNNRN